MKRIYSLLPLILLCSCSGDFLGIDDYDRYETPKYEHIEKGSTQVSICLSYSGDNRLTLDGFELGQFADIRYGFGQTAKDTVNGYNYVPCLGEYYGRVQDIYDFYNLDLGLRAQDKLYGNDEYSRISIARHQFSTNSACSGYRKGNTTYALISAVFMPNKNVISDGGVLIDGTFYVGQADGLIYSSKENAQKAVQNQKVAEYWHGVCYYYIWLIVEDDTDKMTIEIESIDRLGYNKNVLQPDQANFLTSNPDEPTSPIDAIDTVYEYIKLLTLKKD